MVIGGKWKVSIWKEIVDIIITGLFFDETDVLAEDRAMAAFIPVLKEQKDADTAALGRKAAWCTTTMKKQVQFDYVLSLIGAGLS